MSAKWLAFTESNSTPQFRLFCLPFAGGGATTYRSWAHHLPPSVEVCPVELPGRGTRLAEPRQTRLAPLIEALVEGLTPYLDHPFALFGHSMGALLSFELARALRARALPTPLGLFVSAHRAPQLPNEDRDNHLLPDNALQSKLNRLGGTPPQILQYPELMAFALPIIRDDFAICDTYEYQPQEPLSCPIWAYGGVQDQTVSEAHLAAWQAQTSAPFELMMFPGDHFFLNDHRALLLTALSQPLRQLHQSL